MYIFFSFIFFIKLDLYLQADEIAVSSNIATALQSNEFQDKYLIKFQREINVEDSPYLGKQSIHIVEMLDRKKMTRAQRRVRMATVGANEKFLDTLGIGSRTLSRLVLTVVFARF